MSAVEKFLELLKGNKEGMGTGIYSVCSAHYNVIKASMMQAKVDDSIVLIESTSNQVDQNGGYTGMTPSDFVSYVNSIAKEVDFNEDMILLGGDHLGPNTWQNLNAKEAMENSHILIREYVKAGFQKIHLDASMFLADDEGDRHKALADEIVASRAAALCKTAEETWKEFRSGYQKPLYIIGTEVPIPGGAQEEEDSVEATTTDDALRTVEVTKAAFMKEGLEEAWGRVCGLVVQPGVEFGDDQVFDYNRANAADLSRSLDSTPLIFEAHSTDYQTEDGLTKLVEDHFCILKVGPWLTYAYREALFALAEIEKDLFANKISKQSFLIDVLDEVMVDKPGYWQKYYPGSEAEKTYKRKYSFSDRSRYYWPDKTINSAIEKLFNNLNEAGISLSLLSQYMPNQYLAVRAGDIEATPEDLVHNRIMDVLGIYARACNLRRIVTC